MSNRPRVWRLSKYDISQQYAWIDVVKRWDKELWSMLENQEVDKRVSRGKYLYWVSSKSPIIKRILKTTLRNIKREERRKRGRKYDLSEKWRKEVVS